MGIDARMAVKLKSKNDIAILNERIKVIHYPQHLAMVENRPLINDQYFDIELGDYKENTYNVNVEQRYYGEGYERGYPLAMFTQIEWLRAQPEVLEVYYGGDEFVGVLSKEKSIEILFHFFKFGHYLYDSHRGIK